MKVCAARKITGGLSFPSKMPGTSFGLPATGCRAGSKLVKVAGSVCHGCFALKGTYKRGNVAKAHARRMAGLSHPQWVEAMVALLKWTHSHPIWVDLGALGVRRQKAGGERFQLNEAGFHRWHDSGDIQSVEHLRNICAVALLTPGIKHWMPTQELGTVNEYLGLGYGIPENLTIRVSTVMLNDHRPRNWPTTSSVFNIGDAPGHVCPAPENDHRCGSCRACWSRDVPNVAYRQH